MDTHVKVVGWIWIVLSALGLLGMCCAMAFVLFGGAAQGQGGSDTAMGIGITLVALVFVTILIFIPGMAAGYGILQYQSWGRIVGIVLAILNLCSFPIGTAIGAYTLWVLFNEEVVSIFERGGPVDDVIFSEY